MKTKQQELFLEISLVLLFILTLAFGTIRSPFKYSLSMIGNYFGFMIEFIIWGIATGILITIFLVKIYKQTKFKNKKSFRFLYASAFFLILTVITPSFNSGTTPIKLERILENPHAMFGALFGVFLISSLYLFSKHLSQTNKELSIKTTKLLLATIGGSILILTFFGLTGIFELFFFISVFIILFVLKRESKK